MDRVREHERELVAYALDVLPREVPGIELYGPLDAGPARRGRPVQPAGHPPARRRPGAGPVRRRRPRRPPLHDAAPRATGPRGHGPRQLQRLHHSRRHRRADRRHCRGQAGLRELGPAPGALLGASQVRRPTQRALFRRPLVDLVRRAYETRRLLRGAYEVDRNHVPGAATSPKSPDLTARNADPPAHRPNQSVLIRGAYQMSKVARESMPTTST